MKVWAGQTISELGSSITGFALPFVAIGMGAGAAEMGLLGAFSMAPFLLVALFAGAWVDRMRRRRVMILADVGRFILLGLVPVGALTGWLSLPWLYAIALVVGVMTVFFDVAYQSYLPALVDRPNLVEANSKMEVTRSVSGLAGTPAGGYLVNLLGAPFALAADALSFAVSFISLAFVRRPEPDPEPKAADASIWRDIGEGLRTITGNRLLRSIAGCTGTSNLFSSAGGALYVLYATRELHFDALSLSFVSVLFPVGAILGSLAAGATAGRFGLGTTIVGSMFLSGLASFALPLAGGPFWLVYAVVGFGNALAGFLVPVYNINQVSLRQTITPDRLLGRMNASMRFIVWGTMPLGSLLGGALGAWFGLRPALWIAAAGGLASFLWVYFSPVRALREQPSLPAPEPIAAPVP